MQAIGRIFIPLLLGSAALGGVVAWHRHHRNGDLPDVSVSSEGQPLGRDQAATQPTMLRPSLTDIQRPPREGYADPVGPWDRDRSVESSSSSSTNELPEPVGLLRPPLPNQQDI